MCASTKDDRLWFGLVAFVVGAVVLLQRFDVVPVETWDYLWPSILVVSGLKWMVGSCGSASYGMSCDSMCNDCGSSDCKCEMMPVAPAKKASGKKTSKKK